MKIVPLLPAIPNLELLDFCNTDMHRCIKLNSINNVTFIIKWRDILINKWRVY